MFGSLFALFLLTSFVNILSPGLGIVMIISLSVQNGWRRTFWGCLGIAFGIQILFCIALSGMGIIIASNAVLFSVIKLCGAFFLIYLAYKSWTKKVGLTERIEDAAQHLDASRRLDTFLKCVLLSLTNPQPLIFGFSVLPQFIDTHLPYWPQAIVMIGVYGLMVVAVCLGYALLADRARVLLKTPQALRLTYRMTAVVFLFIAFIVIVLASKPFIV